eukprot:3120226-Prorocentrum_lima.AAC.1
MMELRKKPVALLIDLSGYYAHKRGEAEAGDAPIHDVIPLKTTLLRFNMDGKIHLSDARETFRRQATPEEFREEVVNRLRHIAAVHQDM